MPFPNSAFLEKSDICYVDIAESMSSYMLDNFYHLFASSFYQEHSSLDYKISSDILYSNTFSNLLDFITFSKQAISSHIYAPLPDNLPVSSTNIFSFLSMTILNSLIYHYIIMFS